MRRPHAGPGDSSADPRSSGCASGFVLIAMVLSVFGARLVQLQGVDPGSYAAMAAAEGTVDVVLPAERGDILDRNGEPLADSVDGLMVVADPAQTARTPPEIARFLAQRLDVDYIDTLARLREQGSRFEYVARQVPSTLANDVLAEAEARGIEGLSTRRDPVRTYPAHDVAANLIGFMGTDEPFGGLEAGLRHATSPARTAGALRGRRRQPDPARHQRGHQGRRRRRTCTTTIDRDLQWYTQRVLRQAVVEGARRVRDRGDHGLAHRRDPRRRRLPDLRRRRPGGLRRPRPRGPLAQPALRAGLGREGADALRADRRRPDDRPHEVHGARQPGPPGPRHPRLLRARHPEAHPGRDPGQVLQHRHRAGRRPVQAGRAAGLPQRVRPRAAHRRRPRCRVARHPARPVDVDRPDRGPHRVRPVALGHRRPDGRRGQHDRQPTACGSRRA